MYFYRSPSAGIFLFDGKYSWGRTVHARFVTARLLPTALKSLDKFYDVSLRALFFPPFLFFFSSTTNRKENADCRNSYLFIDFQKFLMVMALSKVIIVKSIQGIRFPSS